MAQAEIYLDLDQLQESVIAKNNQKLQEINKVMQSACNTVAVLTVSGWSGESKDAFMQRFTDFKRDMRLFYEYVSQFNKQLKTVHSKGENVYAKGSGIARTL